MNSALGGNKDVEMAGSALFAPLWVQKSEKIRMDLSILKERLSKLKE
jgi:syntaxin 16